MSLQPISHRLVLDGLGDGVVVADSNHRIVYTNTMVEQLLGWARDEMVGKTLAEVLGPEAYEAVRPHIAAVLAGRSVSYEGRVPCAGGGDRYIEATYTPYLVDEWVEGFVALIADVSEKVRLTRERETLLERENRARHAAEKGEERLRYLIENSPYPVAMLDREMRYLFASKRWLADFRLPVTNDLIRGRSHYDVFPEIPEHWKEIHRRCLGGAVERKDAEAFVRADGTVDLVRWEIRPWSDDDGNIGGILIFSEDIQEKMRAITSQKAAEQALRESEERFRILADSAPVLIWVNGPEGAEFVNRTYREFLGVSEADVRSFDWARFIHPDDRAAYINSYLSATEARALFDAEFRFRRHDGEYCWMRSVGQPRFSSSGEYLGYVGATFDMSKMKAAERDREELIAQLRSAIAGRDEFLSIASHELRTPLTTLELQLHGLQRALARAPKDAVEERIRRKIDMAVRQSGRLTRLVEGLSSVSHVNLEALKLELEEFDLVGLVRDTVARHSHEALRAGCTIRVDVPNVLIGKWDRSRIEQALTHLLANAMKYGPDKPIDVVLERESGLATLSVRDHGIGIAADSLERIFERFERAVPSMHYGGLGLGLYIVRQIVEAHGGAIEVFSRETAGATFVITLPCSTSVRARPKVPRQRDNRNV